MKNIKTILITRPLDQAALLAHKIKSLGLKPVIFPAIEIKEIKFNSHIDFNKFNIIVFISPSAILNFYAQIKILPKHLTIFTMGEDSAKMIEELGWPQAIYPRSHFNRDSLLQLPELQDIAQKSILIITGKNRTPELETVLISRGANITPLVVYERQLPQPKNYPDLDEIDIVISTSQESLKNLVTLLGPTLKNKTLLVSSPKLVDLAKILGFSEKPILAQNAGDSAIIQALPIHA
jgi:uroporphyrinogen-III synthase